MYDVKGDYVVKTLGDVSQNCPWQEEEGGGGEGLRVEVWEH